MNIAILDDYQDAVRTLACYRKLDGHTVRIWNDHTKDVATLATRLLPGIEFPYLWRVLVAAATCCAKTPICPKAARHWT